jgi:hypothetical protein
MIAAGIPYDPLSECTTTLLHCTVFLHPTTAVGQKRERQAIGGGADSRPVYPRPYVLP